MAESQWIYYREQFGSQSPNRKTPTFTCTPNTLYVRWEVTRRGAFIKTRVCVCVCVSTGCWNSAPRSLTYTRPQTRWGNKRKRWEKKQYCSVSVHVQGCFKCWDGSVPFSLNRTSPPRPQISSCTAVSSLSLLLPLRKILTDAKDQKLMSINLLKKILNNYYILSISYFIIIDSIQIRFPWPLCSILKFSIYLKM